MFLIHAAQRRTFRAATRFLVLGLVLVVGGAGIASASGGNPSASGGNPSASGGNPSASGGNPSASGGNPSASGGNPSASGGNLKTLTGTWLLTSVIYGQEQHAMVTFFEEGTFISTAASKNNNNAHGFWEKIGPRTFVEKNREFIFVDEELAFFGDTTETIELSKDGMSYVGEAVGELKLLDGTVIDTTTFTIYGTRMTLDF